MPTAISLLRGINVGGHKKIKMADLRALCESLGFRNARSLLQTGNVIFESDESDLARIQARLERGIAAAYGFTVPVIIRSPAAFKSLLARHAFTAAQLAEPRKIAIVFLSDAPRPQALGKLRAKNPGREAIQADGRELFIFYADGQARSKLDNARIEKALDLQATARNWNTCQKLLQLLDEYQA